MRITQGIHTEEFRHVRLGFGEGLGGLVAQTARPSRPLVGSWADTVGRARTRGYV